MLNIILSLVLVVADSARIKVSAEIANNANVMDGKTEGQPLDEKQCREAANRIAGKNPMMSGIALTGYLKEIGQKPTKKLVAKVNTQIGGGCEVSASTPQVSSDASFLNHEQCLEAQARTEGKQGIFLEMILKSYLKEIGKKPSGKMIERVTQQIAESCPEHEEKPLDDSQCLTVEATIQNTDGSPRELNRALKTSVRMFGKTPNAQLITDICQQVSNGCPKTPNPPPPMPKPPAQPKEPKGNGRNGGRSRQYAKMQNQKPEATKGPILNPDECQGAKKAIAGKTSMFAGLHLGNYLKSIGKKGDTKTINKAMKELDEECDVAESVDAESDGESSDEDENEGSKKDEESGPPAVSSGTIRRADFVDDPRFSKYRMMYKIRQPEGAVRGRITMDTPDLLKTGLTEDELDCFVDLLYKKVDECDVAPKSGARKVVTEEFLNDPRLKKYAMMKRIMQPRGAVEGRITMDKADLLKQGLTEAELDCFLKLAFDDVKECDVTPLGKILGLDFVEKEDFKKYKTMHKLKQPRGAIEGRIRMDMADLKAKGYDDVEMQCFLKLLFQETEKCPCGPAGRAESQSKEARGLATAKATYEKFVSLLDGDHGLMPPDLSDISWATSVFEADVPKKEKKEKKKSQKGNGEKAELENYVDAKVAFNLNILLKSFPEKPWGGYIAELARGEFSLAYENLELFQRAIAMIDDTLVGEVKPNLAKITDKHDDAHQLVKSVIEVKYGKDQPPLDDILSCMVNQEAYAKALSNRAASLAQNQDYYKKTSMAVGTFSSAAAGFVYQILKARMAAADEGKEVDKANIAEYDVMLRKLRNSGGDSDGGEAVAAIVPLLAFFNVVINPSNRLRPALAKSNPQAAETLSPQYLDLFKEYFQVIVAAEAVEEEVEEPILSYEDCVLLEEALGKAKNPMFKEMAADKFLKPRNLKKKKAKVLEQLEKNGCVKPAGSGPLTDEECQEALEIYKTAPNPMMQGIKLSGYIRGIGKYTEYSAAEKQVKDGCPSGDAPAPKFVYSKLADLCTTIINDFPVPAYSNSVRGASAGVGETLKGVERCLAVMPPSSQDPFAQLQDEAEAVLDLSHSLQETVFEVLIQASGPFLPHDSKGKVDKKAMRDLMEKLPKAGLDDDSKRIRGESGIQSKYTLVDFLDDEALRHATRLMCTSLFV